MDLGPLRTLALDLTTSAFGVAATVTRPAPDNTPIVTRGIWVTTALDETQPYGTDFKRRDPRRVFAVSKAAVPTLPRGTTVVAPLPEGGADHTWRVDGYDPEVVQAQHRAILILVQ